GSKNVFYKNIFNYCGNSGMGISGSGHRLIDNETSYNNYRKFNTSWHAGGIKLVTWPRDILMSSHIAHDNTGDGIWFDGYCSNITIEKCTSYNNTGCGIFYEISDRGLIKNNICYNNGIRGIYISASSDCGIFHNLVYNNGWEGITIMNAGRQGGFGPDGKFEVKNNYVIGNIMVNNGKPNNRAEMNIEMNSELAYNNFSDYNIFWRTPDDGRKLLLCNGWGKEVFNSLEEWQNTTGRDKNSIFADPRFSDLSNLEFYLQPDSPAIGFVKSLIDVTDDFDKKEREKFKPRDAGPYIFLYR
ncbi:MAG: right-handed parallel beta-helix repeat-containing protein, partial [Candidatus Eremiobacterota bacterium]